MAFWSIVYRVHSLIHYMGWANKSRWKVRLPAQWRRYGKYYRTYELLSGILNSKVSIYVWTAYEPFVTLRSIISYVPAVVIPLRSQKHNIFQLVDSYCVANSHKNHFCGSVHEYDTPYPIIQRMQMSFLFLEGGGFSGLLSKRKTQRRKMRDFESFLV